MTLGTVTALFVLWFPSFAVAQPTAELFGTTYDQTGAALPDVRLTLRGATSFEARSGAAGDFVFRRLPAGDYEMSAESIGFEPARRSVRLQAGERVSVSLTLYVAIVAETIVTAAKAGGRDVGAIPMAITGVSNEEIERLGTQTLGDGAALAPSVTMSQNVGFGQLTIRGIGANVLFAGSDPS